MATLAITVAQILAGPYDPVNGPCVHTTNSLGAPVFPPAGPNLVIWSLANPNVQDPVVTQDGSIFPVTVLLPAIPTPTWRLPLAVSVTLVGTIPTTWKGNRGIVYGNLVVNNQLVPVLEGDPFVVTATPTVPQIARLTGLRFVTGQKFLNPIEDDYEFAIPFRASGDWVWTIRDATDATSPTIPSPTTTRMELNFVAWPAKSGQALLFPASPLVRSSTDFQGSYPVPIQRWSYPHILDLTQSMTQSQVRVYYIRKLVEYVWGYGEAGNGKFQSRYIYDGSSHSMGPFGGIFNLRRWINPENPANHYVNDYDLAAVLQLGCAVALGITGSEIFDSRWVVQYPSGYIAPGQLFGEAQTSKQCNNPFWNTQNAAWSSSPHVDNPYDAQRTAFIAHPWIEVRLDLGTGEKTYVIDATQGLAGQGGVMSPEKGTRARDAYLAAHKDGLYPAFGNNFMVSYVRNQRVKGNDQDWDAGAADGDCYSNPGTRLPRIGVFATNFSMPQYAPPPSWTSGVPAIDNYFHNLQRQGPNLTDADPGKKLQSNPPERFNNASLSASAILALLDPTSAAQLLYHDIQPATDRTALQMVFRLAGSSSSSSTHEDETTPQLSLDLTVYSSAGVARDAAETSMALYRTFINSNAKTEKGHLLGDVAIPTTDEGTVRFVRGNVAARLRWENPASDTDAEGHIDVRALAARLDKHIAAALVGDEASVRRGSVVFHDEAVEAGGTVSVRLREPFTLRTQAVDHAHDSLDAGGGGDTAVGSAQNGSARGIRNSNDTYSRLGTTGVVDPNRVMASASDPLSVVCTTGPSRGDGKLGFVAYRAATFAITLLRPHPETLMPGMRRVVVDVVEEE